MESAAAARVCASYRTPPPDEPDIELLNAPEPVLGKAELTPWIIRIAIA